MGSGSFTSIKYFKSMTIWYYQLLNRLESRYPGSYIDNGLFPEEPNVFYKKLKKS